MYEYVQNQYITVYIRCKGHHLQQRSQKTWPCKCKALLAAHNDLLGPAEMTIKYYAPVTII